MKKYFAGKKKSKAEAGKKKSKAEVEPKKVPDETDAAELLESLLIVAEESEEPDVQIINMYGEVEEEKVGDIAYALRVLSARNVKKKKAHASREGASAFEPDLVELVLSTHGGTAADMFSLYDTIRWCREEGTPILTTGIGKVMSAGVLLLSAGSKGKRKIGQNCRVMLHGVASGHVGQIHNLENELDEAKWTQDRYVKALVKETNMTAAYIKKLFDRRQNVYLTAEEAVELGIADEVF